MSNEEEGALESVALAEEASKKEDVQPQKETGAKIEDPWALPEHDTTSAPRTNEFDDDFDDDSLDQPPNDTQEALSKLKISTVKLGHALSSSAAELDQKVGLTHALGQLQCQVHKVDEKTNLSGTVKSASQRLGGWWNTVDELLKVSQTTKDIGSQLQHTIVEPLKEPVKESWTQSKRTLQDWDETHGVTRSTASTLAAGADLLTQTLGKGEQPPTNAAGNSTSNDDSPGQDDL